MCTCSISDHVWTTYDGGYKYVYIYIKSAADYVGLAQTAPMITESSGKSGDEATQATAVN